MLKKLIAKIEYLLSHTLEEEVSGRFYYYEWRHFINSICLSYDRIWLDQIEVNPILIINFTTVIYNKVLVY